MYTEENEFDYADYNNDKNNKKFNKNLIIKAILIVICLVIILFLVFKLKNSGNNYNNNNNNNDDNINNENIALVFDNNFQSLREVGEKYFFEQGKIPTIQDNEKIVKVINLINDGVISEIYDYDGSKCNYNTSYVSVTKNDNDYLMKVKLECPSMENYAEYYYDLEFNCLTCNGEVYDPEDNTDDENNDNDNGNDTILVCDEWSDWTTDYIEDSSLDTEIRILIKAYKDNIIYGEWSTPTTVKPTETEGIEIKTYTQVEKVTEYTEWSSESTTKPESKDGREIQTNSVKEPYSSTSCKNVTSTYTKVVTGWDSSAKKCTSVLGSFGKYECVYTKTKRKCSTTKKYNTVIYYSYRDQIEKDQEVTYYQTRTVTAGTPIYTDYILESEIPSGYTKVEGSERIEYRYREKCTK